MDQDDRDHTAVPNPAADATRPRGHRGGHTAHEFDTGLLVGQASGVEVPVWLVLRNPRAGAPRPEGRYRPVPSDDHRTSSGASSGQAACSQARHKLSIQTPLCPYWPAASEVPVCGQGAPSAAPLRRPSLGGRGACHPGSEAPRAQLVADRGPCWLSRVGPPLAAGDASSGRLPAWCAPDPSLTRNIRSIRRTPLCELCEYCE